MGKIIAISNQKGGVGKTTTSINLSASLAYLGFEVLLIDIDPQSNSTSGLGINKKTVSKSVYNVLMEEIDIKETILPTELDFLELVPSNIELVGAEIELVSAFSREMRLKKAVEKIKDLYDYIILDCPPSLGLLTVNSLAAADRVLIPIQCEYYALEGLGQLLNTIDVIKKNVNKELEIEGVVLTMHDPRVNLGDQVIENVKKYFPQKVYSTIIPRNIKLSEAPSFGKPIILYDKNSKGAKAYLDLASEMVEVGGPICQKHLVEV